MKYKFAIISAFILFLFTFFGCANSSTLENDYSVAILMHCSSHGSKHIDAEAMQTILVDSGYSTEIYYANKDVSIQDEQIQSLIGIVDAIIIAPVSSDGISESLETASKEGLTIIAYDKLIINTDAVDYFAAYDHSLIGVQQALSLVNGLHENGEPPYNIEIFTGSSNEGNIYEYYFGAITVLQPYIDSGEIIVPSNQISYLDIHDNSYELNGADYRLQNLLDLYYDNNVQLNGILSQNDDMTLDFIDILNNNSDKYAEFPVITGQNAKLKNIQSIVNGQQYSTIFKDPFALSQIAANMVIGSLNGEMPDINDSTTFYNGVKTVPAYLCEPILVTQENYKNVLIDSGYYEYIEIFPDT